MITTKTTYKIYTLFTVLSLFYIGCNQKQEIKKNDLEKSGLYGEIKSIKYESLTVKSKNDTYFPGDKINTYPKSGSYELKEFNRLGNLKLTKYYLGWELNKEEVYLYDNLERLINIKVKQQSSGNYDYIDKNYTYDEKDSLIQEIESDKNTIIIKKIERDNKHRLIQSSIYKGDSILYTVKIKYDVNGNIVKKDFYRKSNIPIKSIQRTYNNQNLIKKETLRDYINRFGWDGSKKLFEYDNKNRLIRIISNYLHDSCYIDITRFYNDENKLIEINKLPIGGLRDRIENEKFDKYGNSVEKSYKNSKGETTKYIIHKYIYDSLGNWTQRTNFYNDKPSSISLRKIKYYN